MKKLLDKLKIQCSYCKNDFNYEIYVYKHFPECYKKYHLVKCPFCFDCKIHSYLIGVYKNNCLKEKEQLLDEIKKYKERIKELENDQKKLSSNKIQYRWSSNQKKQNFTLLNDNKNKK